MKEREIGKEEQREVQNAARRPGGQPISKRASEAGAGCETCSGVDSGSR